MQAAHTVVPISEASHVAVARRAAVALASSVGLPQRTTDDLAIAVTEGATNLAKHAKDGVCLLRGAIARPGTRPGTRAEATGIELLFLDRGPGMTDLAKCMRDGFSTTGSPGTGLGAMKRLAGAFDIQSVQGVGTGVVLEFWRDTERAEAPAGESIAIGAVSVAKPGEFVCGDGWSVHLARDRTALLIVDGLGHGPDAAEASRRAIACFDAQPSRTTAEQVEAIDKALESTRGAAASVTIVDHVANVVHHCGVGNTVGTIVHGEDVKHLVSQPGTLGVRAVRIRNFDYAWGPDATLVLHTDGVSARWDFARYPGLAQKRPNLIAGVLYRDYGRTTDDATVVVAKRVA